jgi:hypothetical protein
MGMVKLKSDHAELQCYHNTEYEIIVDKGMKVFKLENTKYNTPDSKYDIFLYHPSFDYECVYIGNSEDWEDI